MLETFSSESPMLTPIAYFPPLRKSASAALLYSYRLKREVVGFDFSFHAQNAGPVVPGAITEPVDEAIDKGFPILIGQSLGAYAIVQSWEKLRGKKIFLIDGGFENLAAEIETYTLADAYEYCKLDPDVQRRSMAEETSQETARYGEDWGALVGTFLDDTMPNGRNRINPQNWLAVLKILAAAKDWRQKFDRLTRSNEVFTIVPKPYPDIPNQIVIDADLRNICGAVISIISREIGRRI